LSYNSELSKEELKLLQTLSFNDRIKYNIVIKAQADNKVVYPTIIIKELLKYFANTLKDDVDTIKSWALMGFLESEMKYFYSNVERYGNNILICTSPKEFTTKSRDAVFIRCTSSPTSLNVDEFLEDTRELSKRFPVVDDNVQPFESRFSRIYVVTKNMPKSIRFIMHVNKIEYIYNDNGRWTDYWEVKDRIKKEQMKKNG